VRPSFESFVPVEKEENEIENTQKAFNKEFQFSGTEHNVH
jgi:hypothetical protein